MTNVLEPVLAPVSEVPVPKRMFHLREVEWSESGNGKDYVFIGKAVQFGSWSEMLWTPRGSFRERILPGAFADVLADPDLDCRFLINHDKNRVLGRTKAGTLELEETDECLRVWARIARTSYATDLKLSMERGDIDQMSFEFEMDPSRGAEERWYEDRQSGEVRHDVIKATGLFDVSVVTFPAFTDTQATMLRDLQRAQDQGLIRSVSVPKDVQKYKRCRQVVAETPWAILPSTLALIMEILDERASGSRPSQDEIQARVGVKRENETTRQGGAAVVSLVGPVFSRAGAMQQVSGARSLDDFMADFRQALNDPEVTAVVLDIDSPGGTVDGVPEAADEIRKSAGDKPVVAVANYMAASAAFWLAAAAPDGFYASPSAEVGSVGVYSAHRDISERMKMEGQKITMVHAQDSPYKTEFSPFEPLGDEARAELERGVNAYMDMFVDALAKYRGTTRTNVLSNFGQGRMVMAKDAAERGMIDGVATLDDVVAKVNRGTLRREVRAGTTADQNWEYPESDVHIREWLGLGVARVPNPAGGASDASETVEAIDPVAVLKARSAEARQQAREEKVRLTKEMLR